MIPKSSTMAIMNSFKKSTKTSSYFSIPKCCFSTNSSSSSTIFNWDSSSAPMEKVDCVVIGAGVVGISIAKELAFKGRDVLVLESSRTFGTGTSSRNSEVIHAGIYYPPNSLKAKFCVKGREMMYKYCNEHGVPHKKIGKLIVATRETEIPKLNQLLIHGTKNGVDGLTLVEAAEAMSMEPELQCVKALFSPVSGIVDSHSLMLSLLGEAENNGAMISYNTTALGGYIEGNQIKLLVTGTQNLENWREGDTLQAELTLLPKVVINSAGLASVALARRLVGLDKSAIPTAYYARGHYFSLSKTKVPAFKHLIYPIPEDGGLGVHVTLDLDDQVCFLYLSFMVVNATLAVIAKHGMVGKPEISIYQVASSVINPLVYGELGDLIHQHFTRWPCQDAEGRPIRVEPFRFYGSMDDFSSHIWREAVRHISSSMLSSKGKHSRKIGYICKKAVEQAKHLASVYEPYSFYGGRFDNGCTSSLMESMSEEERKTFYFDVGSIDWKDYICNVHIPGLRRHVMKGRKQSG